MLLYTFQMKRLLGLLCVSALLLNERLTIEKTTVDRYCNIKN